MGTCAILGPMTMILAVTLVVFAVLWVVARDQRDAARRGNARLHGELAELEGRLTLAFERACAAELRERQLLARLGMARFHAQDALLVLAPPARGQKVA